MGRGVCFCAAVAGFLFCGLNIQKQSSYVPLRGDKDLKETTLAIHRKV